MSVPEMILPLSGVRVADFSRVLAGPYASMLLADLGAEVIKVEHPSGDETRGWGPPYAAGESAYYLSINRNKRSLRLDLKNPKDRALAYRLIARSEVLLHNFKHGDDEKLGLDFASVTAHNPSLVYANISSFGSSGPDADKPGYDLLAQAVTGFMSITGPPAGEPSKVGVAVIDVLAGLNMALGVVAALYAQRSEGPRARRVETSLLDAGLSSLVNVASAYLMTGRAPGRYGNAHASIVPYQQFQAADAPLVVAAPNDRQFRALAAALGRPEWAEDARFESNPARVAHREVLVPLLEAALRERPRADWLTRLSAAGVPCAPVNTLPEVMESEQVAAQALIQQVAHPDIGILRLVGSGFKLDGERPPVRRHPPRLGEHDAELRRWLEADLPRETGEAP